MIGQLIGSLHRLSGAATAGTAAVEFAITAPLLVMLALGAADYGAIMNNGSSLEGATRAVAEYARDSPYCVGAGLSDSNCVAGINSLVSTLKTNDTSLSSATFTPSATLSTAANYCTCTDGTVVSCSNGTCNVNGDTRVLQYIRITATQNVTPLVSYSKFTFPSSLNAQTTTRIQ